MVCRDDIFIVHVTDDMVIKGVEYAEKSLHYTFNRMGLASHYDRIRHIVSGIIMEEAFKKLLNHHKVKYDLLGNTHWTKKDKYDVGIGGHRYDIKGFFIGNQEKIQEINKDKGWFLDCSALVPTDQVLSRSLKEADVYVFPFLIGREMRNISNIYELFSQKEKKYLVHTFWDYEWFKNPEWKPLGKILIESKMHEKILIRLGGQGANQEFIVEKLLMMENSNKKTDKEFYTVLFFQTNDIPSGDLIVKSVEIKKPEKITPLDWGNVWVYDGLVYISGYIKKGEFREKSKQIPRFYKQCKQYAETKVENCMIYIKDLHPLSDILPKKCDKFIPYEDEYKTGELFVRKVLQEIQREIDEKLKYKEYLPVYSLEAVCGKYGEGREVERSGWISVKNRKLDKDMFIVKSVGKSMEPRIGEGDYCIFRANPVGSRNGKILLVQYREISDPETGGGYTIKKYKSEKIYNKDKTWRHAKISLIPLNPAYKPYVYQNESEDFESEFKVVAEFIDVVK